MQFQHTRLIIDDQDRSSGGLLTFSNEETLGSKHFRHGSGSHGFGQVVDFQQGTMIVIARKRIEQNRDIFGGWVLFHDLENFPAPFRSQSEIQHYGVRRQEK